MKVHRFTLYGFAAWAVLLVYFASRDVDALWLSLILTPILGALLAVAIWRRHQVLALFLAFALIAHAVAPPFFFMRREFYTYGGGFGAVKDFQFGVEELLRMYVGVLLFLAATVVFTLLIPRRTRAAAERTATPGVDIGAGLPPRLRTLCGAGLALFLLAVALPASLFMYNARVGITGIEPPVLAYRMTGILTYFRMFLVPALILIGCGLSNRGVALSLVVLFYAFVAGFASASRFIAVASAAPLVVFAMMDRRMLRFAISVAAGAIFLLVTGSRNFVYVRRMPLVELIATTVRESKAEDFSPFDLVGGIANRVWGPQDVVLASQYHVPSRIDAIRRFFSGQPVVEDIVQEFYGMKIPEDAAFGVGLGYIPWMIVLANGSIAVLLLLAAVTAVFLSISQMLVDLYRASRVRTLAAAAPPLAFFLVYLLLPATLNWWTYAAVLAAAGLVVPGVLRRLAGAAGSGALTR